MSDEQMMATFTANDAEMEQAVVEVKKMASALGVDWRSIINLLLPLVKPLVIDALKRLLERLGNTTGGTTTDPSVVPPS